MTQLYDPTALGHSREMIDEALSVHEVLCRLGFAPAAIRAQLAHTSTPELALFAERTKLYDVCVFVTLAAQGRSWRLCIGPPGVDGITFEHEMKAAMRRWNDSKDAARLYYQRSRAKSQTAEIAAALVAKGFVIPVEQRA